VSETPGTSTGTTQFSFSNNGSLIYLSNATSGTLQEYQVSFVDMNGKATPLRTDSRGSVRAADFPDGKYVAYRLNSSVYIADLTSNATRRQLSTAEPGEAPVWSPNGDRIVFISIYNGNEALFRASQRWDGLSGIALGSCARARVLVRCA
jgi:Tol biopolymer transport system component